MVLSEYRIDLFQGGNVADYRSCNVTKRSVTLIGGKIPFDSNIIS